MKISIDSASEFRNQFIAYNRDNFSCQGYELLFDYFEDCDPDMVLDVISICCDFTEEDAADIARNYSIDLAHLDAEDEDYEEQCTEAVREYLEHNTTIVGETATGFVYVVF
jgi:hypothetical protein